MYILYHDIDSTIIAKLIVATSFYAALLDTITIIVIRKYIILILS